MKTLILLVGNIGSGKSTEAEKWANIGYRVISRDAVRYMMGAGTYVFDTSLEPTIKRSTQALLEEFLKDEVNIVYDEVNVSKKLREPTIKLAKKHGYEVMVVVMPKIDKDMSVNRRLNNNHGDTTRSEWEYVWNMFNEMYEEPTMDEGVNIIAKG